MWSTIVCFGSTDKKLNAGKVKSDWLKKAVAEFYTSRVKAAKVAKKQAEVDARTLESIYSTFERIERSSKYPVEKVSFHASVNPSSDDTCTDKQIFSFIEHLICELGLKNQPVLAYRHNDIEREHYHEDKVGLTLQKESYLMMAALMP